MTLRQFNRQTDLERLVALFATSLNRAGGADWFRWKHIENPVGASPGYVAEEEGRIVGARFFLRWRFQNGRHTVEALRPVDTVTHPEARGRGIFKRLTLLGIEELTPQRKPLIFNTPNNNSLPGYLKMGWQRLPHSFRYAYCLRGFGHHRAVTITKAPTGNLPEPDYPEGVLTTQRTTDFLRWRYYDPAYRFACFSDEGADAGAVVYRQIAVKGIRVLAVSDYVGPPENARPLIDAAASTIGAPLVYVLDGGSTPAQKWPLHFKRGGSLVAVRSDAPPGELSFGLSAGDLESIL